MEHSKSAIMKFLKMVNYPTITGSAFSREGFWVQTPGSQENKQTKQVDCLGEPVKNSDQMLLPGVYEFISI